MNRNSRSLLLFAAIPLGFFAQIAAAQSGVNLVPNGTFSGPDPLKGWRIDFPYEGVYVKNKEYVSVTSEHSPKGGKCAQIDLPPHTAGASGGKIESDFFPAEPGATYKVEIDVMTFDFNAKTWVEAYVVDPKPIPQPDKFRVPGNDLHPPLAMVYRAQLPDPKSKSHEWGTVSREFTVPKSCRVAGKNMAPAYLALKAFVYAPTMEPGKSFFANFRLVKIKSATAEPEPKSFKLPGSDLDGRNLSNKPLAPQPGQ